jgi:sugar phosphate permease
MKCVPFNLTRGIMLCLVSVMYLLVYYHRVWPSILYQELSVAYHVSASKISVFSLMYFWPYAILQPIGRVLADAFDPAFLVAGAGLVSTVGAVLVPVTSNFAVACVGRALIGLGCAPVIVPMSRILANWFSARGFYISQGVIHGFGAIGGILAGGPLHSICVSVGDWRYTFYFVAALNLFCSVMVLIFIRGDPQKAGYDVSSFSGSTGGLDYAPLVGVREAHKDRQRFSDLLRFFVTNSKICLGNPYFWSLTLMNGLLPGAFYNIIGLWGGPYLVDLYNVSEERAGYILSLLNVAYLVSTPIITVISELTRSRKFILCIFGVWAIGLSLWLLFLDPDDGVILIMAVLFIFGFFTIGTTATTITIFKELESVTLSGTMIGWSNLPPFIVTAILQYLPGPIFDAIDGKGKKVHSLKAYRVAVWIPTVVCAVFGCLGMFITKETYPEEDNIPDSLPDPDKVVK